jgi:uncharacterized protein (TIGR03066 family)
MKPVIGLIAVAVVGSAIAAPPPPKVQKKKNEDLIVGTWEMVKSTSGVPTGVVYQIEFTKDGKMFFRIVQGGNARLSYEARYKLEGDGQDRMPYESITPGFDHKETSKIVKLTEDEFAIEDPQGIVEEFKRVKPEQKDEKKEEKKDDGTNRCNG